MKLTRLLSLLSIVSILGISTGCADSEDVSQESDLTGAKTIAKGLARPDALTLIGDQVYFGLNEFIASGDPDLDQQFAYWQGKYNRIPVSGGARDEITRGMPVAKVRKVGDAVLYNGGGSCWIASHPLAPNTESKVVYTAPDCDPEVESVDFEIYGEKVVIVRGSEISIGKADGTAVRKKAEVRVGRELANIDSFVVIEDTFYGLTSMMYPSAGGAGYRTVVVVDLKTGTLTVGPKVDQKLRLADLNAKMVLFNDTTIFAYKKGDRDTTKVADGFGQIADIAATADGTLYVADAGRGAVTRVSDAGAKKRLVSAKDVRSVSIDGKRLVFGTETVTNRKPAGIIGLVELPE